MKPLVLLVEDDEESVSIVSAALTGHGYDVEVHRLSADTLAAFYRNPSRFDLVIIDENMRDIAGSTLARRLLYFASRIPIILLHNRGDVETESRGRAAGIRWFVSKPIEIDTLVGAVEQALGLVPAGGT